MAGKIEKREIDDKWMTGNEFARCVSCAPEFTEWCQVYAPYVFAVSKEGSILVSNESALLAFQNPQEGVLRNEEFAVTRGVPYRVLPKLGVRVTSNSTNKIQACIVDQIVRYVKEQNGSIKVAELCRIFGVNNAMIMGRVVSDLPFQPGIQVKGEYISKSKTGRKSAVESDEVKEAPRKKKSKFDYPTIESLLGALNSYSNKSLSTLSDDIGCPQANLIVPLFELERMSLVVRTPHRESTGWCYTIRDDFLGKIILDYHIVQIDLGANFRDRIPDNLYPCEDQVLRAIYEHRKETNEPFTTFQIERRLERILPTDTIVLMRRSGLLSKIWRDLEAILIYQNLKFTVGTKLMERLSKSYE